MGGFKLIHILHYTLAQSEKVIPFDSLVKLLITSKRKSLLGTVGL